MSWKSCPYKEHPRRTFFLVIFLIGIWVGVYFSFGLYGVIIALILLGGGLLSYWLPTYYSLDEEWIKIKGIISEKSKKWEEFRSYYEDKNGVFLSPFAKPKRLENYRGVYIRFNNNAEEVIGFISARIKKTTEVIGN